MTDSSKCPVCGKSPKKELRPFCSRRCANVDLGRWMDGRYAIPTDEAPGFAPPGAQPEDLE